MTNEIINQETPKLVDVMVLKDFRGKKAGQIIQMTEEEADGFSGEAVLDSDNIVTIHNAYVERVDILDGN